MSQLLFVKTTVRAHPARNPSGTGMHLVRQHTRRTTRSAKDYRHLDLNVYPPAGVEVEESGGGTNWALRWRSPATGKIVQAYPTEFRRAQDAKKFGRIRGMQRTLPKLRARINRDLDGKDAEMRRTLAAIVGVSATRSKIALALGAAEDEILPTIGRRLVEPRRTLRAREGQPLTEPRGGADHAADPPENGGLPQRHNAIKRVVHHDARRQAARMSCICGTRCQHQGV